MSATAVTPWTLDAFMETIHRGRVGLWSWNVETRVARFDDFSRELWGGLKGPDQDVDALFATMHPDDRADAERRWLASAESPGPYEFDFRVEQEDGVDRWISARGTGREGGRKGDDVIAVFVDVTKLYAARRAEETVAREMAHRVANLFTVASSTVRLVGRETTEVPELVSDLERRFTDLGRAYRYAMRDGADGPSVALDGVLGELLEAHGAGSDRIVLDVPSVPIAAARIAELSLVFHELATNAVKYGALGAAEGRVTVSGARGDDGTLHLLWQESGGPRLDAAPETGGFGTKMIERTVVAMFGGKVERSVTDGGLGVRLTLSEAALAEG